MKKILLFGNLGWMLVLMLGLTKCNNELPSSGTTTLPENCTGVTGMEANSFLEGLARYKKNQLSAINDRLSSTMNNRFEDARSCWYSIDKLKKFICLIEENSKPFFGDKGLPNLGIRFYYATYPNIEQQEVVQANGVKENVPVGMHHTLFMVPTAYNRETDVNVDLFLPINFRSGISNPNDTALLALPKLEGYLKTSTTLLVLGKEKNTILGPSVTNQGMLCPPTCPFSAAITLNMADALILDK